MPRKRAKWTVGNVDRRVDPDGKAHASVPLVDDGKVQGRVRFEMDANRNLIVFWEPEPGVDPLAGFSAWSKT